MLGRGATLPGDCHFAGGGVEATFVIARYTCAGDTVVVELRDAEDAPAAAQRTRQFAVSVSSGPAPPELPKALARLVRAHEAAFEWRQVSVLRRDAFGLRLGPTALAGCAAIIILITLTLQYIVASAQRDRGAPQAPGQVPPSRRGKGARGIGLLIAAFLLTRILFLTRLPVYVDESVHIDWARDFFDAHFVPEFSVGRWLPMRIMSLFLLLPIEPLFAARLGSVAMGLVVLVGCILIGRELFSSTEGLLAGVVYTLLPFALLYDRMALVDVYLVAFGTWIIYLSVLAARRSQPVTSVLLGLCVCGAILSKATGGLFLIVPILVGFLFADRVAYFGRVWPALVGGAALLSFLLWAGYGAGLLTSQVAFEGGGQLTTVLLPNLEESFRWFTALLTPLVTWVTVIAAAVAVVAVVAGARAELFLALLLALAVLPFALVSQTWYPSYLLFAVVPVSLLVARAISLSAAAASRAALVLNVSFEAPIRRASTVIAIVLLVYATAPLGAALLMRPHEARLPPIETSRYVSGALSGYGLPELSEFLRTQAQTQPVNVVRFDLVQPSKEGLDVYLSPTETIHLYSIDHRDDDAAATIAALAQKRRTLFVSNPEVELSLGIALADFVGKAERVWSHTRPGARTRLEVWELGKGD